MTAAQSRLQSWAVLLVVIPLAVAGAMVRMSGEPDWRTILEGALFSVGLAVLVLVARAATPAAAATGALLAFCYALASSPRHSALWLLGMMLLLTLGASRVGRGRKSEQGTTEAHGRTAPQVAANLGAGALAGVLGPDGGILAQTMLLAALAEATADTLASELGQLATRRPRMLLTGREMPPGTDGAVSVPGTLAGICGAGVLAVLARQAFALPWWGVGVGFGAGVFGMVFDSALGEVCERRGWLNNDAINFLSTLAACLVAVTVAWVLS